MKQARVYLATSQRSKRVQKMAKIGSAKLSRVSNSIHQVQLSIQVLMASRHLDLWREPRGHRSLSCSPPLPCPETCTTITTTPHPVVSTCDGRHAASTPRKAVLNPR